MVDHGLYARQALAHSFGLDKEVVEKRYPALRPAWGQEWLAKVADDVEEGVPALSGLFDAIWGSKPKIENHGAEWWAKHRPRPHRGESADPRVAAAKTKKELDERAAEAAKAASAAEAKAEKEAEEAADRKNEQEAKELDFATMETQKRRLSFFGRPAHKFRLKKVAAEIERKSHENQAVLWAHLWSDADTEYEEQLGINQTERRKKEKAASSAASYRAEETGARAAAAGLKPWGSQLQKAMRDAQAAENKYRELAEEQEALARRAKIAEDNAFELMQQEDEKRRICQAQISAERKAAKAKFETCARIEEDELKALVAEENMLEEFITVWKTRLSKVAKGSPPYFMIEAQIDQFDLRLDVVAMEKRMYVPMYLKRATSLKSYPSHVDTEWERLVHDTFRIKKDGSGRLDYVPSTKPIKWIYEKQHAKDGKVGLGKGAVGPELKFRKRIVQTLGAGEHEDIDELKDLPEEACDSLYENPIKLIADFVENAGPLGGVFLSRKDKEAGEKVAATTLKKEVFEKVWGQDPRHKVEINRQFFSVRLRHRPTFKWCCQWIPDDENTQKHKLQRSYVLGPQKLPYIHSRAPAFHSKDAPNKILDANTGLPRRFGRIHQWFLEEGMVEKGQELVSFRVYEPGLIHPKKNPNGRFPYNKPELKDDDPEDVTKRKREEIAKIDEAMEFLVDGGVGEWRDDEEEDDEDDVVRTDRDKIDQPKILVLKSTGRGELTGLLRDPGSKILSFDNLAMFDAGKDNWEKMLLPVSEWPTEFFG